LNLQREHTHRPFILAANLAVPAVFFLMAAGGSRVSSARRGAKSERGAKIRREDLAPSPFVDTPYVPAIDSLEEISGWLGTFRERLRMARAEDRTDLTGTLQRLEARLELRRAELS